MGGEFEPMRAGQGSTDPAAPGPGFAPLFPDDDAGLQMQRKVPRRLHLWFAGALGGLALLALSLQHLLPQLWPVWSSAPEARQAAGASAEPPLASLQRELARQKGERAAGPRSFGELPRGGMRATTTQSAASSALGANAVAAEPLPRAQPAEVQIPAIPPLEDPDTALPRELLPVPPSAGVEARHYEQDKAHSLIAGSHILALSHVADSSANAAEFDPAPPGAGGRRHTDASRRLLELLGSAPELLHALPALLGSATQSLGSAVRPLAGRPDAVPPGSEPGDDAPAPTAPEALPLRLRPASPGLVILEGTPIACILLTEVRSDLPGIVVAQVSDDVYDSVTAQRRLIPRGTRLIGRYQSQVAAGQQRLFASFHRLILPGGASVDLQRVDAADEAGASGLQDEVDTHFWQRFGQSFLTAGLARAAQRGDAPGVLGAGGTILPGAGATGQILVETSRASLQAGSALGTTLRIRRGMRFQVMVSRDLALPEVPEP